jgi:hypothetical protein
MRKDNIMDRHDRATTFHPESHTDDGVAHQVVSGSGSGLAIPSIWIFKMVDSINFATPETGLTVTVEGSIDGAAFGSLTDSPAVSEIGNGWYKVSIPSEDRAGDSLLLKATASGAAQTDAVFYQ